MELPLSLSREGSKSVDVSTKRFGQVVELVFELLLVERHDPQVDDVLGGLPGELVLRDLKDLDLVPESFHGLVESMRKQRIQIRQLEKCLYLR